MENKNMENENKETKNENTIINSSSNWHEKHIAKMTFGQRIADKVAISMGSWRFIIIQTIIVIIWMTLNIIGIINHWDPYPFILLNLLFSTQAAYAAPIIMMAQNRQNDRDRVQASEDFATNISAKKEIEELQQAIARIENDKLDKISKALEAIQAKMK
jgi:uncharacterized membrane protein